MLAAFEEAGLAESQSEWIVGNWVGDPAEVEVDPDSLCAGARPAEHPSHFFTADGGFGSTTTAANRLITATTRSSTLEFSSAASSSCSNRLRSSARTTAGRAIRQVGIAAALMHAPTAIFSGEAAADDHASDSRHNSVAPPVAAGRGPYPKPRFGPGDDTCIRNWAPASVGLNEHPAVAFEVLRVVEPPIRLVPNWGQKACSSSSSALVMSVHVIDLYLNAIDDPRSARPGSSCLTCLAVSLWALVVARRRRQHDQTQPSS